MKMESYSIWIFVVLATFFILAHLFAIDTLMYHRDNAIRIFLVHINLGADLMLFYLGSISSEE